MVFLHTEITNNWYKMFEIQKDLLKELKKKLELIRGFL